MLTNRGRGLKVAPMRIPFFSRREPVLAASPDSAFSRRSMVNQLAQAANLAPVATSVSPALPPKSPDQRLTEIQPPFGTNPPEAPVAGMGQDIGTRTVHNDPRELWYLALPDKLSPKQILQILRSALGGDIWQQWQLCSLMLDSWPMFRKCSHELREAASNANYAVHPYVEEGSEPTDTAMEKAQTVRRAMKNFKPNPFTDEKEWTGFVYDLGDAMLNGLSMSELMWTVVDGPDGPERLPRAAAWVHPRHFTFTNDGTIAVFDDDYRRLMYNMAGRIGVTPDMRKFICAQFMSRSGSSLGAGLMRPLAWYWAAVVFNREWMMKAAQNYGAPFLDVTYKPNTLQEDLKRLDAEIAQGLANRFVRHKEGTTLAVTAAQSMGTDNPQRHMAEMADEACTFLFLGQEGTTKTQPGSLGGKDDSKSEVKRERVEGLAKWLGTGPLAQFARATLLCNWGEDSECPTITPDFTAATDPLAQAQRDTIFITGKVPMKVEEFYPANNLTVPEPGDLVTVGGQIGYFLKTPAGGDPDIPVVGAPPPPPSFDEFGNPKSPDDEVGVDAPPGGGEDAVQSRRIGRAALGRATAAELDEIEELVTAAERASHKNGEHAALRTKLTAIAKRKALR